MKQIKQELVDELPICKDGREKITNLLKGMGYEIENTDRKPKPGEVWRSSGGDVVLVLETDKMVWINDNQLSDLSASGYCRTELAKSLEEYYEKKAKGDFDHA